MRRRRRPRRRGASHRRGFMAEHALPVLMYHGLHANAGAAGVFDGVYSVTPHEFARQLDWLQEHGYRSVRLRDAEQARLTSRCVVITFDDGDVSNRSVALPLLTARGMTAEFFVTSGFVGRPGRLDEGDVRALAAAGMGVQSHGSTHRYLEELDARALDIELRDSKRRLEALAGEAVEALALPGGRGAERERQAALRLGYRDVLNSAPGCNPRYARGHYLQRLAITRGLTLDEFAHLVQWRGALPRTRQLRYRALAWMKRALGNRRYERLRRRVLQQ